MTSPAKQAAEKINSGFHCFRMFDHEFGLASKAAIEAIAAIIEAEYKPLVNNHKKLIETCF